MSEKQSDVFISPEIVITFMEGRMLKIPGGKFVMGDEKTGQLGVTVNDFMMEKFPVIQALYQRVINYNPSSIVDDRPAGDVSWFDAIRFCNRLSNFQGIEEAYKIDDGRNVTLLDCSDGYRLPTEAEWEYACRAETTGERYGELDEIAWYSSNSRRTTHNVGQKKPNRFGLYDMLGNVWEWCWDNWERPYPDGFAADPCAMGRRKPDPDPEDYMKRYRFCRGGDINSDAACCRSTSRNYGSLHYYTSGHISGYDLHGSGYDGYHAIGLRLVRSLPTATLKQAKMNLSSSANPSLAPVIHTSIGIELKFIPAGQFMMGSPPDEKERYDKESLRQVTISRPFYLGVTPVTVGQFKQFVEDAKYPAQVCRDVSYDVIALEEDLTYWKEKIFLKQLGITQTDSSCLAKVSLNDAIALSHPVVEVSWNFAIVFCNWLSAKEGLTSCYQTTTIIGLGENCDFDANGYRLPTEAEWEYACRAGTKTPFSTGCNLTTNQANYDKNHALFPNPKDEDRRATTPVRTFPANPWGLFDMHGNVWEWCWDRYIVDYKAPDHFCRGGSWHDRERSCRSACYIFRYQNCHFNDLGFRVAKSLP